MYRRVPVHTRASVLISTSIIKGIVLEGMTIVTVPLEILKGSIKQSPTIAHVVPTPFIQRYVNSPPRTEGGFGPESDLGLPMMLLSWYSFATLELPKIFAQKDLPCNLKLLRNASEVVSFLRGALTLMASEK